MPNSAQFRSSCRICFAAESMVMGAPPNTCSVRVGVEWSIVARVRSGRRTFRPRSRRALNACGEVTSCVRCRSTNITAGVSADCGRTSWADQTFSNSVRGEDISGHRLRAPRLLDAVYDLEEGARRGLDDIGGGARTTVAALVVLDIHHRFALRVLAL